MRTKLLLCSAAGAAAAAGATVCRWLLLETGEVLLLLFADNDEFRRKQAAADDYHGDYYWRYHCPASSSSSSSVGGAMGGTLLRSIATSPILRSAPLILLFLSSAAFVVAVAMSREDFRRCRSRATELRARGEKCALRLLASASTSAGCSSSSTEMCDDAGGGETSSSIERTKETLLRRADALVLDDALRACARTMADFFAGLAGGVLLYGLTAPDGIFPCPSDARDVRRRLVRAADPSLEGILFRPGGAWELLPQGARRYFLTKDDSGGGRGECGFVTPKAAICAERIAEDEGSRNGDTEEEGSHDTSLASLGGADADVGAGNDCRRDIVCIDEGDSADEGEKEVTALDGGEKAVSCKALSPSSQCSTETLVDAVSGAVKDLVLSNFMASATRRNSDREIGEGRCTKSHGPGRPIKLPPPPPPPPSFPPLILETTLRRIAATASFLFLCHLRGSPSARKSWTLATNFLASVGLVSTAVGAGVASQILHSNGALFDSMASHPLAGAVWCKLLDGLGWARTTDVAGRRMRCLFDRLMKEVRGNERLRAALALVAFGAIRSLSRRGAGRRGGMR